MPGSRNHRGYDSSDYTYNRGQDRTRPRVRRRSSSYDYSDHNYSRGQRSTRPQLHHRSSSYDDRYDRRPRTTRRYHDYSDHDDYDDYDGYSTAPKRRQRARSEGHPSRRRRQERSRSRSREWREETARKRRDQAIRSALTAGAVEAVRQRNRPGEWMGAKGIRVATAAMSAGAIDTAVDRDPRRKGKRKLLGSALVGIFVDKITRGLGGGRH